MAIFLRQLPRHLRRYRPVLVLDGAAWHWNQSLGQIDNIRLLFQPTYSPEINPVGHLWGHIREKYLHNFIWKTLDELNNELIRILQEVKFSTQIIQSLVGFHWIIFNV